NCAQTVTLTINVILGDAIVCWRAYAVWQGNRIVLCASVALLLTTFGLATVDTTYTCTYSIIHGPDSTQLDPKAIGNGTLYGGVSYGVAASMLSLCTNLYATTAVALKAWRSRRFLRRYIVTGPMVSQTEKVLSLLVESGAIYCAVWILVAAYQTGVYFQNPATQCGATDCQSSYYHSFWYIFGVTMNAALVPVIAIYPTIIIILVALNRSHMENGFMKATESGFRGALLVPLRQLTVTADSTAVSTQQCDIERQRSSETVLATCDQDFAPEERMEGSSTHTGKERKLDIVV
ncbi:hypothetical protein V8D89_010038, partial [Ganoderma adspersum]